jgi:hypothetical protein
MFLLAMMGLGFVLESGIASSSSLIDNGSPYSTSKVGWKVSKKVFFMKLAYCSADF